MFDWKDYFELAQVLETNKESQSRQRSAVSRAYYACFNAAKLWVIANAEFRADGTGSDHQGVRNCLKRPGATEQEKQIAHLLASLSRLRGLADYDASALVNAANALTDAKRVFDLLSKLTKRSTP